MIGNYDAINIEKEMLEFWAKKKIYESLKKRNKGKQHYYFLDGPPYTSGKVHLGTAWNKSLKDCILRYKRMQGLDVFDRPGYDMHGMPTEQGVEKELKIKHKDEIPRLGVAKFVTACREFSLRNLKMMTEDFKRMGVWMDFDNAYKSIDNEYIEGEWWLIKKAHENNRLYEGEKTMHWCAKCGTSLAKHELDYKNIKEESIFLKFPIKKKGKEFLIIWTTTPWTIPFNLGIMVNPEIDYVKAELENGEKWIVAKALSGVFISGVANKKFKIINEFKGANLEGIEYIHPLSDDIYEYKKLKEEMPKVHTIVLSEEYVDTSAGSGLVHMAPGCGPEDYEVGHRNGIRPFNNLTESGVFPEGFGKFGGLNAKKDDNKIVEELENKGALIAKTEVEHDYAHCWRCKKPVIYRTTKQWFFKVEDLKDEMRKLNKDIYWVPDYAGSRHYDSWLENLRDNGITRQRYWGTPLPIWKCNIYNGFIVIGSIAELKKLAGKIPEDLHKPWIDEVKIKCSCGGEKERIPDILDVWIDAGSASWNALDFPREKALFGKLFPADFILEGIDQIRGWFNLLFVASMVSMKKPSFEAVYMHGFINDAQGRKMSKSLGNYILPQEVVEKYGADTLRYYMIGGTKPGVNINYNFDDMKIKNKNLAVYWNLHKYIIDMAKNMKVNPSKLEINEKQFSVEEKYIFSKLNSAVNSITKKFEKYHIDETPWIAEHLLLELSRTYIQLTREKSSIGTEEGKKIALYTAFNVFVGGLKIFSPIIPFLTEKIYQNLKKEFSLKEESIHLYKWPEFSEHLINKKLEREIEIAQEVSSAILYAREKIQLGVRWPLSEVVIVTNDKSIAGEMIDTIKKTTNIKEIKMQDKLEGVKELVRADYNQIGPDFGSRAPKIIAKLSMESPATIMNHIEKDGKYTLNVDGEKINIVKEHLIFQREIPQQYQEVQFKSGFIYLNKTMDDELEAEGYAREIMRRIQEQRKKHGLQKKDRISLFIQASNDLLDMLAKWQDQIKEKVGAENLKISELSPSKKHKFNSKEKVKGKEFEIFFDKV